MSPSIPVTGGDVWPFRIYVRGATPRICEESYDEMAPEWAVNMPAILDGASVCASCGGLISSDTKTEYNRVHGFSGFDEYNEHDNDTEEVIDE